MFYKLDSSGLRGRVVGRWVIEVYDGLKVADFVSKRNVTNISDALVSKDM
jgi:hypothetical protein